MSTLRSLARAMFLMAAGSDLLPAQSAVQLAPIARVGVAVNSGAFEDHGVTQSLGFAKFAGVGLRIAHPSSSTSVQIHSEITTSSRVHYQSVPPCDGCRQDGPAVNIMLAGVDLEGRARPWPATQLRIGAGAGIRRLATFASGCGGLCQPNPTGHPLDVWEVCSGLERWSGRHVLGLELSMRSGPINGHLVQTAMLSVNAAF